MKLFLIDTVSSHRITYVVQAEDREAAEAAIYANDVKEFSQAWLGEQTVRSLVITHDEYLEQFNKDNEYLAEWTDEQKLTLINTVNYNDP